jgi:hypothetical protein
MFFDRFGFLQELLLLRVLPQQRLHDFLKIKSFLGFFFR